jgi:hypothetical protein
MNRLEQQMTSTSMRRRRLSSGRGITRVDWRYVIASLQLTICASRGAQDPAAERSVTAL